MLDYDGTVVATEDRFGPPASEILVEIRRLMDSGISIAFATGRGGSIGEMLRHSLPQSYHEQILVGYYNGAWIVPLSTDIRVAPPPEDAAIAEARRRLVSLDNFFHGHWVPKEAMLQLTIPRAKLVEEGRCVSWLYEGLADLPLRILRSGHSVDVFPAWASKRDVVGQIRKHFVIPEAQVLCIGDRGERFGNDHELLEGPFGVSVGEVCDRLDTCWNLTPESSSGPAGLLLMLKALTVPLRGKAKMIAPVSLSLG